jgi:hypothetical protein
MAVRVLSLRAHKDAAGTVTLLSLVRCRNQQRGARVAALARGLRVLTLLGSRDARTSSAFAFSISSQRCAYRSCLMRIRFARSSREKAFLSEKQSVAPQS